MWNSRVFVKKFFTAYKYSCISTLTPFCNAPTQIEHHKPKWVRSSSKFVDDTQTKAPREHQIGATRPHFSLIVWMSLTHRSAQQLQNAVHDCRLLFLDDSLQHHWLWLVPGGCVCAMHGTKVGCPTANGPQTGYGYSQFPCPLDGLPDID
jgi:hypothetical protein